MSASPAVMNRPTENTILTSGRSGGEAGSQVSPKWRLGQGIVTVAILALAVYYNTVGWHSPPGETTIVDSRGLMDQVGFVLLAALVWITTPTAGVIAVTTFQEAVRRRWMTAMLAFALVILALSTFFTWMQPGEEQKFLLDFGMGFIIIITLLMSIFLGVALVPPEIERRTIFTILSKPVDRLEFIIGKYLGLCLTLMINLSLMGLMFLASFVMYSIRREGGLGPAMVYNLAAEHPGLAFEITALTRALVLQGGQLAIMAGLALLMSLVVTNITAIVFCFLAYFGGQMSAYLEHLGNDEDSGTNGGVGLSRPVASFVRTVYFLLPRLDRFDVNERLVNMMPVGFNYMWKTVDSGLIYVAALLTISYLVFSEREF